jgi:hypothetical protein
VKELERLRKREKRAYMHLSEKEAARLEKRVKTSGLSQEAFMRRACLEDGAIVIVDRLLLTKIYAEINRLGNNVNQIAHWANSNKDVTPKQVDMMLEWQRQLQLTVSRELGGIKKCRRF